MKYRRNVTFGIALLVLAACTTTRQATSSLNSTWAGQNTDAFFVRYGGPQSSYKMNDGNRLYTWANHGSVPMPAVSNTTGSYDPLSGSFQSTTITNGGGSAGVECTIQIIAAQDGRIVRISVTRDTWGLWETSRCNEIFG